MKEQEKQCYTTDTSKDIGVGYGELSRGCLDNTTQFSVKKNSIIPIMNPNALVKFQGNEEEVVGRIKNMTNEEWENLIQAHICLDGKPVAEGDQKCRAYTICLGAFFIFPLCFMCCNWWKKKTSNIYSIQLQSYNQILFKLLSCPHIRCISLSVTDNHFGKSKAFAIYSNIKTSKLISFTFENKATPFDCEGHQYSDFKDHMNPIKSLNIQTNIKWN